LKIIFKEQVSLHRKEKPGVFGGKEGWLFLTENRLVFVKSKEIEKFNREGKGELEIPQSKMVEKHN
jgi:hypothetical protein